MTASSPCGTDPAVVFTRTDAELGEFALRPVDPHGDAELLHSWVTHPKAEFWQMQDADLAAVVKEFTQIAARPHHDALLGLHDGRPAFLVERYAPAHSELAEVYPVAPGDVGMHFLAAPTNAPVHGFTHAVITTVMELLFTDPETLRVVVEPDVRNRAVHELNEAVGFQVVDTVSLPDKDAYLSMCTRAQYRAASTSSGTSR